MTESSAAVWLVLLIAVVAANLPFVNERLFIVGPRRHPKGLGWRVLELVLLWGVTIAAGSALEGRLGQIQPQGWEFYAAFGCLFLTLAFPGFIWRYLRRGAT
ncbi:MAG TPA: DUF2818 family protein [Burkholderiaceae bacterium]|nr:DUF2818 family protein [Burkholderiaceae bacterium]